jgi:3-methyl-2-oxobutanoate hydroxymethyltransferase
MITVYDYPFARLVDHTTAELILVGDSLGMVIQGLEHTNPVTLDEIIYHVKAVRRGAPNTLVVGDMPFMSYQLSPEQALASAGRIVKEGGADCVKLEGGMHVADTVLKIVQAGIPVMGHIGLTPQSFHQMGGFKIQGRQQGAVKKLVDDARALQEAGAYSIVLEGMPSPVARRITEAIDIPTIGIGAGSDCDGQVLVIYDLLGMDESFKPKFVRRFESLGTRIRTAVDNYVAEVRDGSFPNENESFSMNPKKRDKRKPAEVVSALAHVGGCAPPLGKSPGPKATTASESNDGDETGGLYPTIKR